MATLLEGLISWATGTITTLFIVGLNKRIFEKRIEKLLDWVEHGLKKIIRMVMRR